ncbi:MAG: ABC transporter substrate-binding protein [Deltaproteobacteria bacterium]|nr:ABC transporter substrate-binding protein [Deltaproteobacteria bacterium]
MSITKGHKGKIGVCLLAMVLVLPLLASSTWAKDLRKITFRYSWILYGHAPAYYYAKDLGLWEKEGLDVTILTGKGSGTSVKLMGAGQDHFGTADYGTMMKGVVRGIPVKGVFGELQIHPMSVAIPAKHGAKAPADLVGKSIAVTAGGGDQAMLPAFLNANGLKGKVKVVQLSSGGAKREALLQGKVDGIVAYVNEQVPQIEAAGVKLNVLKFAEHGAPLLGVGIIINTKTLEDGDLIRKFLRGLSGGIQAAIKNPDAAVDSALKVFKERKRNTVMKEMLASFPLFQTKNSKGKPLGWTAKADWESAQEILFKYGGLKKKIDVSRYYTNDFISQ